MRRLNQWEMPACNLFSGAPRDITAWRYAWDLHEAGASWADVAERCGRSVDALNHSVLRYAVAAGLHTAKRRSDRQPAGAVVELQLVRDFLCRIDRHLVDAFDSYAATSARHKLAAMKRQSSEVST